MLLFHEAAPSCMSVGCEHVSGRNILFPVSKQGEKQIAFRRNISAADNF